MDEAWRRVLLGSSGLGAIAALVVGCALLLLTGSVGLALEGEPVNRLRQTLSRWRP